MKALALKILVTAALILAAANPSNAESCEVLCIDWYTINASGGIILSDDGDDPPQWQLSGTIGQWEATEARELSGDAWRLTGGFWSQTLEELADRLFRDRFEHE